MFGNFLPCDILFDLSRGSSRLRSLCCLHSIHIIVGSAFFLHLFSSTQVKPRFSSFLFRNWSPWSKVFVIFASGMTKLPDLRSIILFISSPNPRLTCTFDLEWCFFDLWLGLLSSLANISVIRTKNSGIGLDHATANQNAQVTEDLQRNYQSLFSYQRLQNALLNTAKVFAREIK